MLNLYEMTSRDKTIEHPELGTISCQGLKENYESCQEMMQTDQEKLKCDETRLFAIQCFKNNEKAFYQYLDDYIKERRAFNAV